MLITYQQAKALVDYFECKATESTEAILVHSDAYPDFAGRPGLYVYTATYEKEYAAHSYLSFLGDR